METKNFNEMVAYDFSNLNLQQEGNDNCFANPCDEPACDCDCDDGGCDEHCDEQCDCDNCDNCDCDVCDNNGCEICDHYEE